MTNNEKQNGQSDHPGGEASQQAQQTIARFINRFSQSAAGYLALARHAAMPFILTPELLNYIRTEFLSDQVDWAAEADLLLSDLCQEIGYEQYAMKLEVRAHLIAEARRELGEQRMEEIARRLLTWVNHLARTNSRIRPHDLQSQQWGAMVYLKERREEAVREMASALGKIRVAAGVGDAAIHVIPDRAEVVRVSAVITDLAHQLEEYQELVEYAALTTRLLNDATGAVAREMMRSGQLARQFEVARIGEKLPSLAAIARHFLEEDTPPLSTFTFETVTLDARGKTVRNGRRKLSAQQFVEEPDDGVNLEMVEIPGGTFLMGTSDEDFEKVRKEHKRYGWDEEWIKWEMPQHKVTVPPFFIGKFTVTQKQWRIVAGWEKVEQELKPDPSSFKGDDRPVENVNWEHAKEFCARLAKQTGRLYRLPSESEWEYACRAGTTTPFAFGETITHETVNYNSEYPYAKAKKQKYRGETVPVGSLGVANAFGLFDMHGNVWEWCEDVWHDNYNEAPTDGSAWLSGGDSSRRMLRGGSYVNYAGDCRSAYRNDSDARVIYGRVGLRVCVSARIS